MSDIFREVEEEVRRDRLVSFWHNYGTLLIAGIVLIVLGVGGYQAWTHFSAQSREAETQTLMQATAPLEMSNYQDAINRLSAARTELSGDMDALAGFREAQAHMDAGEPGAAVTVLDDIAAESGVSSEYRNLATIYAAVLELDEAGFDEINARLGQLVASGSAWRFSARELIAFSAFENDMPDVARENFEELSVDPEAPLPLRQRAQSALQVLNSGGDVTIESDNTVDGGAAAPQPALPEAEVGQGDAE